MGSVSYTALTPLSFLERSARVWPGKVAGYKTPRDIDITVKLPKTSTGKIQKYMLREREWTGHARRVQG
jgi:acyl-coenzyme A synthetase/AMP-(fatty) acid ligase